MIYDLIVKHFIFSGKHISSQNSTECTTYSEATRPYTSDFISKLRLWPSLMSGSFNVNHFIFCLSSTFAMTFYQSMIWTMERHFTAAAKCWSWYTRIRIRKIVLLLSILSLAVGPLASGLEFIWKELDCPLDWILVRLYVIICNTCTHLYV